MNTPINVSIAFIWERKLNLGQNRRHVTSGFTRQETGVSLTPSWNLLKILQYMPMTLINRKLYEIQRSWHNLRRHSLITSVFLGRTGEKYEGQSASREVRNDFYKYVKRGHLKDVIMPAGANEYF